MGISGRVDKHMTYGADCNFCYLESFMQFGNYSCLYFLLLCVCSYTYVCTFDHYLVI
jgi:hypothetical protein